MKFIRFKKYISTSLFVVMLNFYGCQSNCQTNCPVECVPISFVLTQDGKDILQCPTSFRIDSMRVETSPENPDAPPLLGLNGNSFKLVVCQNVEYTLHLNDSLAVEIFVKLDTLSIDKCCVYFAANSIEFNGDEICSNQDQCGSGTFELN